MNKKNITWLFNFASSFSGGGLKRLIETVKWFDMNGGAQFIVNSQAASKIKTYSDNNIFFEVSPQKILRLLNDGYYLNDILREAKKPDIYFSYGLPIFYSIAEINWFHVSNALTLRTKGIDLKISKRIEMSILKNRILSSLMHANIVTAESQYALGLVKKNSCYNFYTSILPNGFDVNEFEYIGCKKSDYQSYAITIGSYKYKKLLVAYNLFKELNKLGNKLEKFIIVGDIKDVPSSLLSNRDVVVDRCDNRDDLVNLLSYAKYYISASQIENSSIAALEGLILSDNIAISNIPSHYEMLEKIPYKVILEPQSDTQFLVAKNSEKILDNFNFSWDHSTDQLYKILHNYNESL